MTNKRPSGGAGATRGKLQLWKRGKGAGFAGGACVAYGAYFLYHSYPSMKLITNLEEFA